MAELVPVIEGRRDLRTLHMSVTGACLRSCPMCMDRGDGALPADTALDLAAQARHAGVQVLAVGGGEPALWPGLADLARAAEAGRAPRLVVTTTMAAAACFPGVEIHLSWDEDHAIGGYVLDEARRDAQRTAVHGLNHVVTSPAWLRAALTLPVPRILLLGRKPATWSVPEWAINMACLAGKAVFVDCCAHEECGQGRWSMHIGRDGTVARCSHTRAARAGLDGGLAGAWRRLAADPGACPREVRG